MSTRIQECLALYALAFPQDDPDFIKAFFDTYAEDCLRVIEQEGRVASMLFSLPYPVLSARGTLPARYLYAVATHPDFRGRGLARALVAKEAAAGPVFLRPMQPSLFAFYQSAGLTPFSPVLVERGAAVAAPTLPTPVALTPAAYLTCRDAASPRPCCRMSEDFLRLIALSGGMVCTGQTVALYERVGEQVLFKELWGDPTLAPALAAALGGKEYELRRPAPDGTPFGVMHGIPAESCFLAAMD